MSVNTFKIDLERGHQVEDELLQIIQEKYPKAYRHIGYNKDYDLYIPEIEKSVEVKSDFKSKYTGNIVVEIEFNGKPSALMTTKADYWVWNDGFDFTWFKPQDIMKCLLLENIPQKQFVAKGDSKSKRAYLVKKEILYKYKIL